MSLVPLSLQVFGPILHQIRDHGERYIGAQSLSGIVSFPSYHAACALIFAWALWPVKWLRWPAVALNTAMALAAIPIGAHYFIDVLAGLIVRPTRGSQWRLTFYPKKGRGAKGLSLEEEAVDHLRREDRHRT